MEISVQSFKRVELLSVSGRIDSGTAPQLEESLRQLTDNGRHRIVAELSGVSYMSSAGLRALVGALRECKKHGGEVVIATPSERVADVLKLAGLDAVFQVFGDTVSAVGSF
ncbi:MAG: STAS domain-containing protein [Chloroflexota bacterium]